MSEPGPKTGGAQPEPAQGGALWALIVGGAILVVAALLIFWPAGDSAPGSAAAGKGKGGSAGQQASLAQGGGAGPGGEAYGVGVRDYDPNRSGKPRVNPALIPTGSGGTTLAPPRKPKPEPTSFPSAAAEIEYWEKKLATAQHELAQRTLFLERLQRVKENARTSEQIDTAERRGAIVQKNYDDQKKVVEDLEKKVADLKEKQRQSGSY